MGAVILAIGPITNIVIYQINHPPISSTDSRLWRPPWHSRGRPPAGTHPDIYFIIPDDYARTDILRRYFHFDNTPFTEQLQRRGFRISAAGQESLLR